VDISPDLRSAKVFYSVLGRKKQMKKSILKSTKDGKHSRNI